MVTNYPVGTRVRQKDRHPFSCLWGLEGTIVPKTGSLDYDVMFDDDDYIWHFYEDELIPDIFMLACKEALEDNDES